MRTFTNSDCITKNGLLGVTLLVFITFIASTYAVAETQDFDHFNTGYPLSGMHIQVKCEACHIKGTFKGTPRQCVQCHNGQFAPGKPSRHVRSNNVCDDCHTTFAWQAATFDHSSATGLCMHCHNGNVTEGKHNRHIITNADCEACHITTAWLPTNFNHDDIIGSCRTCHAKDLPRDHVVSSADCEACHLTTAWKPARFFDHDLIVGNCRDCHLDDLPSNHLQTAEECNACHNTQSWRPGMYDHSFFTVEHNRDWSCNVCHTSSFEQVTWRHPDYQPDCAGCHAANYKAGSHKKFADNDTLYTVDELRDCAGSCHKESKPLAGHHSPAGSW